MPILIQEIIITAAVEPSESSARLRDDLHHPDREEIIEACVAETLKIQRQKRER